MTDRVDRRPLDRAGPYVGLDYFAERDADLFFGRDAERQMIIGNLRASRLTLLYAQSGVGKSSLLRAGVAARLRRQAERHAADEGSPRTVPVVFSGWRDDPVAGLIEEIEKAARPFLADGSTLELPRDRLDDAIAIATNALAATALVMLDQFEEYFLYHADDVGGERFADGLARCVARDDVRANFLIAIREDAYSSIGDRFQARIHNVYGNYLHLDYLDRAAARKAIKEPIARLNDGLAAGAPRYDIEEELVDDVLAQVRRARVNPDGGGRGADDIAVAGSSERFDTAYLQLVMERLWDEERRGESRVLRAATLRRLKGAEAIIRSHVHSAMDALQDEQRVAMASAFRFLVTSSGRKIALTAGELADFSRCSETVLAPALRQLENARILRAVAAGGPSGNGDERSEAAIRWELFHDLLADPILSWRNEQDARQARQRLEEAKEEARRAKRRSAVLLGLVVLAVAGLVVAVVSYLEAVETGHERDSQKLAVASGAALAADPDKSVGLALRGLDKATTAEAEYALRVALPASRLRSILPGAEGSGSPAQGLGPSVVTSVSSGPGAMLATGESTGRVSVWRWSSKLELLRLEERQRVTNVQLAAGGTRLLTATTSRVSLWDVDRCTADRACDPVQSWPDRDVSVAAMGTDGCVVARSAAVVRLRRVSDCDAGGRCQPPARQKLRTRWPVAWMAFARGSCRLAVVTRDGSVAVWRAAGGSYRLAYRMRTDWDDVKHVALSRNGNLVAAAGDLSFRVWDLTDCERAGSGLATCSVLKSETTPDRVNGISFAPDEQRVVLATADGVARIWDLNAAEPLIALHGHGDEVFAATFDASGRYVATASADGTTRVWEASAGDVVVRNREPIRQAQFMAGGKRIVAAGEDGTVRIYGRDDEWREEAVLLGSATPTVLSPAELKRARGTEDFPYVSELSAVAPSPDGRWILTGAMDGTLLRWDVRMCVRTFVCDWLQASQNFGRPSVGAFTPVRGITYDPEGRLIAVAKDSDGTWILSGSDGEPRGRMLSDGQTRSTGAAFNAAGDRLVTTTEDGDPGVWDVSGCLTGSCKPELLRTLPHPCTVATAAFSPDGRRILTGCGDHIARIWTWQDRRAVPVLLRGHTSNIRGVAFTPDGRRAVTAGTDRTTRIWDARTERDAGAARILGVQQMHTNRVRSVAIDPNDPAVMLTAGDDGTARLYRCTACYPSLETLQRVAEGLRAKVHRRPQLLR